MQNTFSEKPQEGGVKLTSPAFLELNVCLFIEQPKIILLS